MMLNRFSIRAQLVFAGGVALVFLVLMLVLNLYSNRVSGQALADIYESNVSPLLAIQEMDSDLKEIRFRIAGVLLDQMPGVGSRNHLQEVKSRLPKAWTEFKQRVRPETASAEEMELAGKLDKDLAALPAFFDKLEQAYKADDKKVLGGLLEDDWPAIQQKILKPLSLLIPMEAAAVKRTYEASTVLGTRLNYSALGLFAISAVLLVLTLGSLTLSISRGVNLLKGTLGKVAEGDLGIKCDLDRKDELGAMADSINTTVERLSAIIRGVKSAADHLSSSATQLSSESAQVSQRVQQQSDRVMQTSAAMEEIGASVHEIASGSGEVARASSETQQIARNSSAQTTHSIATTHRIAEAVESSAHVIGELAAATDRINEVTKVIKDIADQTNLLALNAAIEAARAGEQGRGFAVVADEVRKLAERTSTSTGDISGIVEEIRKKTASAVDAMREVKDEVNTGVAASSEAAVSLKLILESAQKVAELADRIAAATHEQTTASDSTARSMAEVLGMFEENTASIDRVKHVASETNQTAHELQQMVDRFRL